MSIYNVILCNYVLLYQNKATLVSIIHAFYILSDITLIYCFIDYLNLYCINSIYARAFSIFMSVLDILLYLFLSYVIKIYNFLQFKWIYVNWYSLGAVYPPFFLLITLECCTCLVKLTYQKDMFHTWECSSFQRANFFYIYRRFLTSVCRSRIDYALYCVYHLKHTCTTDISCIFKTNHQNIQVLEDVWPVIDHIFVILSLVVSLAIKLYHVILV